MIDYVTFRKPKRQNEQTENVSLKIIRIMNEIMAMVIVATISYAIYKLFELFARRKERMAMIEKLSAGIDPEIFNNQFKPIRMPVIQNFTNNSWAIRIGMLLLGVGLGITIATLVDLGVSTSFLDYKDSYQFRTTVDVLYPACAAVFGGIGLVIAYFIEKKEGKKDSHKADN